MIVKKWTVDFCCFLSMLTKFHVTFFLFHFHKLIFVFLSKQVIHFTGKTNNVKHRSTKQTFSIHTGNYDVTIPWRSSYWFCSNFEVPVKFTDFFKCCHAGCNFVISLKIISMRSSCSCKSFINHVTSWKALGSINFEKKN